MSIFGTAEGHSSRFEVVNSVGEFKVAGLVRGTNEGRARTDLRPRCRGISGGLGHGSRGIGEGGSFEVSLARAGPQTP